MLLSFIFSLIIFIFISIISFTIPGLIYLNKINLKLSFWEKIILGTGFGYCLFSLISYILLIVHAGWLILPLIGLLPIIYFKQLKQIVNQLSFPTRTHTIILALVFFFGVALQLAVIAPSGLSIGGNLVFWSAHGHDGPWHISLMHELNQGFPFQNPVLAGEKLINYHFFSDIAPAIFSKYFFLSPLDLYFRLFPLLFSVMLGSLVFLLGKKLGKSFLSGIWASLFTYFAGSFGWIVTWLQNHTISGESIFWATQTQSSIGNPPQIAEFVVMLTFLLLLEKFIAKRNEQINRWLFIACALSAGSLIVFKVYGGVVVLASLAIVGMWQLLKEKRIQLFVLFLSSLALSSILYFPNTAKSTSFLIFEPWWYIRTMVVGTDRLNWLDLELRRQTYIAEHNYKRVLQLELTGFLIFLFGNLGLRFVGFFIIIKKFRLVLNDYFLQVLTIIMLISFIMPLLFLQKGVASNSIQFYQYFLLLMGVFAGISIANLQDKIRFKTFNILFSLVLILLMIPTQLGLIYNFYSHKPLSQITTDEIQALEFLKNIPRPNSIILTPPYNKYFKPVSSPPDIWSWYDSAYVSAFSNKRTFLTDNEQVSILDYNFKNRAKTQVTIFSTQDQTEFIALLETNHIDYLYFPKLLKPEIDLDKTSFKKVFSNSKVEIWQIN